MPQQASFSTTMAGTSLCASIFSRSWPDAGLVVVHVTGREDRHLARGVLAVPAPERRRPASRRLRNLALLVLGQHAVLVHAQHRFHDRARGAVLVDGIDDLHHHRNRGELAHGVGAGEQLVAKPGLALLELDRLGAQHQVREIHVPGMRRHVRTLGHVAHVAQVALVDDLPVDPASPPRRPPASCFRRSGRTASETRCTDSRSGGSRDRCRRRGAVHRTPCLRRRSPPTSSRADAGWAPPGCLREQS